jgi:hypothetical protein
VIISNFNRASKVSNPVLTAGIGAGLKCRSHIRLLYRSC